MKDNFDKALRLVLIHEGGYVNDPQDPGGATNKGITQQIYDSWRKRHNLPSQNVRMLSMAEIEAIYRAQYWDLVRGDELPTGLDYAMFDFGINSGVGRAVRFLQEVVGATPDGSIGPATLAAISAHNSAALIDQLCAKRLAWLASLPTFEHFGHGWTTRVKEVQSQAEGMI